MICQHISAYLTKLIAIEKTEDQAVYKKVNGFEKICTKNVLKIIFMAQLDTATLDNIITFEMHLEVMCDHGRK